jgi:pyruvate/2-oxoglutarate/acetoin dehydrogenase E1 component
MKPNTKTPSRKPIMEVFIAGFMFATLFWTLHVVQASECRLFHNVAWVVFLVLRPAVSAAWQSAPVHFCDTSGLLQHVLQIVVTIRPLLCAIAN